MRSKAPLALMEQVVMILVFALAAALCLQVFVFSDRMSRRNEQVDEAVLLAQNAAEQLKTDGTAAAETRWYHADLTPAADAHEAAYRVEICPEESGVTGLGQAAVAVFPAGGAAELFRLTVAWQEVTGHG